LNSIARSSHPEAKWNRASDEVIEAFEKVKQQDSDELLVLAPYAHLVSLKRGKPSPIHAAGLCRIWFESELADVMRVVSSPSTLMVVVDANSTCAPLQMLHPDKQREPRLADLLRREFLEVFEKDDCTDQHPKFFVGSSIMTSQRNTSGWPSSLIKAWTALSLV